MNDHNPSHGGANVAPLSTIIEYDDGAVAVDLSKIPHSSAMALARFGLAHYLGNQQASKVSAAKAKALESSRDADGNVVAGRELSTEEIASLKAHFRAEGMKAIAEGTMGAGARGPSKDPFEAALDSIVRESVKETLRKYGLKVPKGEDGVVTFADGTTRTMAQMIQNRLSKEGDALRRAATKKVNDDRKKADALRAAAAANSGKEISVEDLGL